MAVRSTLSCLKKNIKPFQVRTPYDSRVTYILLVKFPLKSQRKFFFISQP
jgi:hypothetical protein